MGMGEDYSFFGERRREIGKSARIRKECRDGGGVILREKGDRNDLPQLIRRTIMLLVFSRIFRSNTSLIIF